MEKQHRGTAWATARAWRATPRGLWIGARQLADAESDLGRVQRGGDERILTVADVRDLRDAYRELVEWACGRADIDPISAIVTMWGGARRLRGATESSDPELATVARAQGGAIHVARSIAPEALAGQSLGRRLKRTVRGPLPARGDLPRLGGLVGIYFGGRWVWQ